MTATHYETKFGSLERFEKGGVQIIDDNVKHYAFSNCFEVASKAEPYEKVVFGQNQIYVLEALRAEGPSPWYTCAHDEFALCMDGEVEFGQALDRWQLAVRAFDGEPSGLPFGHHVTQQRVQQSLGCCPWKSSNDRALAPKSSG